MTCNQMYIDQQQAELRRLRSEADEAYQRMRYSTSQVASEASRQLREIERKINEVDQEIKEIEEQDRRYHALQDNQLKVSEMLSDLKRKLEPPQQGNTL